MPLTSLTFSKRWCVLQDPCYVCNDAQSQKSTDIFLNQPAYNFAASRRSSLFTPATTGKTLTTLPAQEGRSLLLVTRRYVNQHRTDNMIHLPHQYHMNDPDPFMVWRCVQTTSGMILQGDICIICCTMFAVSASSAAWKLDCWHH